MDNNPFAELRRRDPPSSQDDRSASANHRSPNESQAPIAPTIAGYSSANDYATAVRAWLWAYQTWHMSQFLTPLYVQQFLFHQHQRLSNGSGPSSGIGSGSSTAVQSPFQNAAPPDVDVRTVPFQTLQGMHIRFCTYARGLQLVENRR